MKNQLLPAIASLIIGMTAFAGTSAYADKASGVSAQTPSRWCSSEGPNTFEPNCSGNIAEREGKAAYGEPRAEKTEPAGAPLQFCSSEGKNVFEPKC